MKNQSDVREKSKDTQHGSSVPNSQQGAQPEGVSWQFYAVMAVIGLGLLLLVGKALGLF